MCVTHFHLFTLADTAHMCFDTISCTSSISPFLFQRQELMKRGVGVHGGSNAPCTHTLLDSVVLTEGSAMVWNWAVSWRGQNEDAGVQPPAGLRRWALFDPPPAETTSLRNIVHLCCSRSCWPRPWGSNQQHQIRKVFLFLWFDPQPTASHCEDQY